MRITFLIPAVSLSGGVRVVATYASRLQRRGHQVLVVSRPPPMPTLKERAQSFLSGNGWSTRFRRETSHFHGLDIDVRLIEEWRPITDADLPNADVVIATWWATAEWVAQLSSSKGAKVHFIQGDDQLVFAREREELRKRITATWFLPMHKIVVSKWLQDLVWERCGSCSVSLVPNSVDTTLFWSEPRGMQRVPTVGLTYATPPLKGVDICLDAFSIAKRQLPTLQLLAYGADSPSKQLPLPAGVGYSLRPSQRTIAGIYSVCDGWLFGSRYEGFGLPILEAFACRTPVVATPAGAAPELLAGGGGMLVKPENPDSMAEAIVRLCTMPEERWKALSCIAHATAHEYNWDHATDLLEQAFNLAICESRRRDIAAVHNGVFRR
jgi:glycosyltransferase involved in cell wall biosynthesis